MADITYDFTAQSDVNPWVASGWSKATGSSNGRISLSLYTSVNSSNAIYLYNSAITPVSNKIHTSIVNGNFTGDSLGSRGNAIMSAAGDGIFTLIRQSDIRVYRTTVGGGSNTLNQIGSTTAITAADNDIFDLEYDVSNGNIVVRKNGTSIFTATDTTHIFTTGSPDPVKIAALRSGVCSRAATGRVREVTVFDVAAPVAITSINSGNPVTVGQAGVVIAHTGFTGAVTSVTTNRSGVTCAITAGDANSTTVTVSGWVEGSAYPVVDNTVTFTCARGAESASATQTLTKPANYAQVTFSGAITDDPNLIGYHLAANGHTVNGGTFYYRTNQVSTLTVNVDTSWTSDPAGGTFSATFIPSSGATSGNAYLFDITLLNGSIVSLNSTGYMGIGIRIGLGI